MNKQENFINRAKEKFGDKFDYSKVEYVDLRTKVCIKCREHGEFWVTPVSLMKGSMVCPECVVEWKRSKYSFTKDQFIEKAKSIHGNKFDYSFVEYVNTDTNVNIVCPIHGEFYQTPYRHLKSETGCPSCSLLIPHRKRLTEHEMLKRFREIHGDKYEYVIEDYKNRRSKIKIICPHHGEYYQTVGEHLDGYGCPKCTLKSQTRIYNKLSSMYESLKFEYSTEWIFPQRFDMYLEKYNIAIEYNGEQHYRPIKKFGGELGFQKCQQRDKLKREKCLQNDCKLFEIRYDHEEEDLQHIINEINKIIENYET